MPLHGGGNQGGKNKTRIMITVGSSQRGYQCWIVVLVAKEDRGEVNIS